MKLVGTAIKTFKYRSIYIWHMRAPSRFPNRLHFTLAQFSTRPSSACISRFFVFNIHIYVFQTSRLIKILCTFYTFLQHASKRKLNFVYWRKNEKKLEKYIFLSKNCIIDCARAPKLYIWSFFAKHLRAFRCMHHFITFNYFIALERFAYINLCDPAHFALAQTFTMIWNIGNY